MEPIQYPYNKEKEELENRIKILEKKLLHQNEFIISFSKYFKEQIIDAYDEGKYLSSGKNFNGETYYNNTYGKYK